MWIVLRFLRCTMVHPLEPFSLFYNRCILEPFQSLGCPPTSVSCHNQWLCIRDLYLRQAGALRLWQCNPFGCVLNSSKFTSKSLQVKRWAYSKMESPKPICAQHRAAHQTGSQRSHFTDSGSRAEGARILDMFSLLLTLLLKSSIHKTWTKWENLTAWASRLCKDPRAQTPTVEKPAGNYYYLLLISWFRQEFD